MDRLELEKRMRKALGTYTNSLVLKMASNAADVAEEYAESKAENLPISDVSKRFSKEEIIHELEECGSLQQAIAWFKSNDSQRKS